MLFSQDASEEPVAQSSSSGHRNPPLPPVALNLFAEQARTVLIADQSPAVRYLIQRVLQKEHFHVIAVEDSLSGLLRIADYHPHLILLSIHLPRLDGYHLCRIIRKNLQFASIPVIMLGAQEDSSSYAMHGHLAGPTDFLMKPFDSRQIVQVVKKYLPDL